MFDVPHLKHIYGFLSGNNSTESSPMFRKSIEAYEDVKYKPIFAYILRQESGMADTIDKYVESWRLQFIFVGWKVSGSCS